jgi:cyclopropane fatty-acyl-phospholipid synthase-like methyltransferase
MDWPYEIAERDHELQNPTSREKILLLGDHLRLTPESRVLDVACGKGGPATILAGAFGCRITGVEIRPVFADAARERVAAAGLEEASSGRAKPVRSARGGQPTLLPWALRP